MKAFSEQQLDAIFSALGDSTRRAIVVRLLDGDATVTELTEPFDISQPAISRHLKVLEQAGLISRSQVAQQRPAHLEADALGVAIDWLEAQRTMWTQRLDQLDEFLMTLKPTED